MGDNSVFLGTNTKKVKWHCCILQKYFVELDAAYNRVFFCLCCLLRGCRQSPSRLWQRFSTCAYCADVVNLELMDHPEKIKSSEVPKALSLL